MSYCRLANTHDHPADASLHWEGTSGMRKRPTTAPSTGARRMPTSNTS